MNTKLKTVKDWLNTLDEPYRSEAITNSEKAGLLKAEAASIVDAMYMAFTWDNSPQGHKYWAKLVYDQKAKEELTTKS